MSAPRPRTQVERREGTRAKLIQATIGAIAEVGYHRASVGEICVRAGVSKGGLFRHFDTRTDLVVAAAEEVGRRHLESFAAIRGPQTTLDDELLFVRDRIRSAVNSVWLELLVAARTEPELRDRLAPAITRFYDGIEAAASDEYGGDGVPDDRLRLVVTSVLHLLDGEALLHAVYPRPDLERARLTAVGELVGAIVTGRV
ncbi:MAG: TetR/AcrR family transcriptional regulator [Jatrophihabitans sp.]|uniref:TetR/AcrR family transcriptional regulator n=1 Tax=Jatrophihabitans sp. TaxID=1932789 RepID=UPI003F80DC48